MTGASAPQTGLSQAEPKEVSALRASIPSAAFTPGPWFVGPAPRTGDLCVQTVDPLGAWICGQLHNPTGAMSRAVAEANARLIAAAPELYGALESLLGQFDQAHDALGVERSKSAKNAIVTAFTVLRQARGETPNDGSIPSDD